MGDPCPHTQPDDVSFLSFRAVFILAVLFVSSGLFVSLFDCLLVICFVSETSLSFRNKTRGICIKYSIVCAEPWLSNQPN